MRRAPPSTTAQQRHGACHPKQRTPTTHATHIAHSHAEYRYTSRARPHDVPHTTNHCALRSDHRMHTAARTPRTARHTAPTTPHAAHRKSHPVTHAASATLTSELPGCPASTGCCRRVGCSTTPSSCMTHEQPSRHKRIAAHRTTSIKSSQMKASQHTECYLSRTTPCASDPKYETTRQPTGS
jgi:hypothetical protein